MHCKPPEYASLYFWGPATAGGPAAFLGLHRQVYTGLQRDGSITNLYSLYDIWEQGIYLGKS